MTALAAILLHSEYQIPLFGLLAKLGNELVPLVNVRDLIGHICPKINRPIGQTYQYRPGSSQRPNLLRTLQSIPSRAGPPSISPEQPHHLALDADPVGRQD